MIALSGSDWAGDQFQAHLSVLFDLAICLLFDPFEQPVQCSNPVRLDGARQPERKDRFPSTSGHATGAAAKHAHQHMIVSEVVEDYSELFLNVSKHI